MLRVVFIIILVTSGFVEAATEKIEVKKPKPEVKETSEITDARARAMAGSSSKFHLKFELEYEGSSVETPFADEKYDFEKGRPGPTFMEGTFAGRYRLDKSTTIGLGSGLKVDKPFQSPENFVMSNPYLAFNKSYRAGLWQMYTSLKHSWYTDRSDSKFGKNTQWALDHYMVRGMRSKLSYGTVLSYEKNLFNRALNLKEYFVVDYAFAFLPFVQYRLNQKVSFRTSLGLLALHNRKQKEEWTFFDLEPFQSLGVSYRYNPDFYIFPYITFLPKDIRSDSTTLSVKAIFSVL